MNYLRTKGIVLTRVDYGEADRIVTVITQDHGKVTFMAKGVRRIKSKLSGGIELFSVSELVLTEGRGKMSTLISARLIKHYGNIVNRVERTMLAYDLLKTLHKVTEDATDSEYFALLIEALEAFDDDAISIDLINTWFSAQLIRLAGHTPNLAKSVDGKQLAADLIYEFDYDAVAFREAREGTFSANEIKILRLIFAGATPKALVSIDKIEKYMGNIRELVMTLRRLYLRA